MAAPNPIDLKGRLDDNLAEDVNQLQDQIGDLADLDTGNTPETNYGDFQETRGSVTGFGINSVGGTVSPDPPNHEDYYRVVGNNFAYTSLTYSIVDVNVGNKTFTILGNYTAIFNLSVYFLVQSSPGNDGGYSVLSSVYTAPYTIITISGSPMPSAVPGGEIYHYHPQGQIIKWNKNTNSWEGDGQYFQFNNLDSNRDLTSAFEDIRDKILSKANTYNIIFDVYDEGAKVDRGITNADEHGHIWIKLNKTIETKWGEPMQVGDRIIISDTDDYDSPVDTPVVIAEVNHTENKIRVPGTFNATHQKTLPYGVITYLDGSGGKVLQHGVELLPAGSIIMILGSKANAESGDEANIAGEDNPSECPPGYMLCNNSLIDDYNSRFYGKYTPNMESLFVIGESQGYHTPDLVNNPSIGGVWSLDYHFHGLSDHRHRFLHEHEHSHVNSHRHELNDHIHDISHGHGTPIHVHKVGSYTSTEWTGGGSDNSDKSTFDYCRKDDMDEPDGWHKHYIDHETLGPDNSSASYIKHTGGTLKWNEIAPSGKNIGYTSTNNQSLSYLAGEDIVQVRSQDGNSANPYTRGPFGQTQTDLGINITRFKTALFCMKV